MKKYLIIAAAALTALTACSKVDTESTTPDIKIGYQVANYATQTKAEDTHGHTSLIDEINELDGSAAKAFLNTCSGR